MKYVTILCLMTLFVSKSFGQLCTAEFNYTIGNNNVVSFSDSSTNNCQSFGPVCCYSFSFGDTASGALNTFSPFGGHFYEYPGTYYPCEFLSYQSPSCSCSDSVCHPINITDTGSFCQANYCYTAVDSMGMLFVTLINISTADDSIENVYWVFNDGTESIQYTNVPHFYAQPVPDQLTYLYIQTASGCQSVILDTIIVGTTCDTALLGVFNPISNLTDFLTIYPTVVNSTATISTNITGRQIMLHLYDILGKQVCEFDITNNRTLDRSNIQTGMYFYRATVDNRTVKTGKLIFD